MRYDVADWDRAVDALLGASEVAIACHVNPDGDALGSLLAASLGVRKAGKTTFPSWGSRPLKVPFGYGFLPGIESLLEPDDVPRVDTFLALDCGARDRLGDLGDAAGGASCVINVDHHAGNDNFGDLNLVVPTASSTAELVARLLHDLNIEFDPDIATCLYTGLVTDTGRFQYSNCSADTLRLAADLLAFDVAATDISREVFDSSPFEYLKLVGRVLDRAVLFERERFVYSWITREDLEQTGVALDETEKLIDVLRSTRAADVAAIYKQQPDGRFRVSLRSKGPVSVGALARARGGGGHELAAGFTADDVDASVHDLREALKPAVEV